MFFQNDKQYQNLNGTCSPNSEKQASNRYIYQSRNKSLNYSNDAYDLQFENVQLSGEKPSLRGSNFQRVGLKELKGYIFKSPSSQDRLNQLELSSLESERQPGKIKPNSPCQKATVFKSGEQFRWEKLQREKMKILANLKSERTHSNNKYYNQGNAYSSREFAKTDPNRQIYDTRYINTEFQSNDISSMFDSQLQHTDSNFGLYDTDKILKDFREAIHQSEQINASLNLAQPNFSRQSNLSFGQTMSQKNSIYQDDSQSQYSKHAHNDYLNLSGGDKLSVRFENQNKLTSNSEQSAYKTFNISEVSSFVHAKQFKTPQELHIFFQQLNNEFANLNQLSSYFESQKMQYDQNWNTFIFNDVATNHLIQRVYIPSVNISKQLFLPKFPSISFMMLHYQLLNQEQGEYSVIYHEDANFYQFMKQQLNTLGVVTESITPEHVFQFLAQLQEKSHLNDISHSFGNTNKINYQQTQNITQQQQQNVQFSYANQSMQNHQQIKGDEANLNHQNNQENYFFDNQDNYQQTQHQNFDKNPFKSMYSSSIDESFILPVEQNLYQSDHNNIYQTQYLNQPQHLNEDQMQQSYSGKYDSIQQSKFDSSQISPNSQQQQQYSQMQSPDSLKKEALGQSIILPQLNQSQNQNNNTIGQIQPIQQIGTSIGKSNINQPNMNNSAQQNQISQSSIGPNNKINGSFVQGQNSPQLSQGSPQKIQPANTINLNASSKTQVSNQQLNTSALNKSSVIQQSTNSPMKSQIPQNQNVTNSQLGPNKASPIQQTSNPANNKQQQPNSSFNSPQKIPQQINQNKMIGTSPPVLNKNGTAQQQGTQSMLPGSMNYQQQPNSGINSLQKIPQQVNQNKMTSTSPPVLNKNGTAQQQGTQSMLPGSMNYVQSKPITMSQTQTNKQQTPLKSGNSLQNSQLQAQKDNQQLTIDSETSLLQDGIEVQKFGFKQVFCTAPKTKTIKWSQDLSVFSWNALPGLVPVGLKEDLNKKSFKNKVFNFGDVVEILDGMQSENFKKYQKAYQSKQDHAFSIRMKLRTIDMLANSAQQKQQYVACLRQAMIAFKQKLSQQEKIHAQVINKLNSVLVSKSGEMKIYQKIQ